MLRFLVVEERSQSRAPNTVTLSLPIVKIVTAQRTYMHCKVIARTEVHGTQVALSSGMETKAMKLTIYNHGAKGSSYEVHLDNGELYCYTSNDDDGWKLKVALAILSIRRDEG